ncbi:hydroxyacylglutathione hydrolase [Shewanella khirikhana]|uniref:hydroxyacylglutathione hydrolase n=1 Tax=Shewanella khirikhana TaxID=1965282 RepID=UPI0030D4F764
MYSITPIAAFNDNYIWMLGPIDGGDGVLLVDPGDASPVIATLEQQGLRVAAVLLTHHHGDHSGGISGLRQWASSRGESFKVYGAASSEFTDVPCHDGDTLMLPELAAVPPSMQVLAVPGHTLDHLAFVIDNALFCGDTLFSAGCGRLFEGTPEQLFDSLAKIKALPADTQVYCAHEYTQSNLKFAAVVEPDNQALADYIQDVNARRQLGKPSIPTVLATELAINPFLRTEQPQLAAAVSAHWQQAVTDAVTCLALLRRWKDNF